MHSHWRWPWQNRTPFNTQESVTQQISHSLYLGHFSRCSLHLPVETYILASSVIIEPRNSLYFTCDWNGSKLNRVYINCAVNVPNRRKKLSFDATLRTCERRKESCDRFECVHVSIVFELRLESQRCTHPIYWEHAGNRKVQQICIAVGQLAEVWFHVQHQSEAKSVIRLFKEQNLFLPSHVIHYMWPASCTHTHALVRVRVFVVHKRRLFFCSFKPQFSSKCECVCVQRAVLWVVGPMEWQLIFWNFRHLFAAF